MSGGLQRGDGFPRSRRSEEAFDWAGVLAIGVVLGLVFFVGTMFV